MLHDVLEGWESRDKARAIMTAHGFGPDKRIKLKLSTRNLPTYRDASVILISQLKEIYIDAELDTVETGVWFAKIARGDYAVGVNELRRWHRPRLEVLAGAGADVLALETIPCLAEVEALLMERERLQSTGIGDGVAIPHTAVEEAETQAAALLLCPKGIDFESYLWGRRSVPAPSFFCGARLAVAGTAVAVATMAVTVTAVALRKGRHWEQQRSH